MAPNSSASSATGTVSRVLAAALEELALDPDRRKRMAEAAMARGDAYDIGKAVRRIEEIYRETLRTKG